MISENDFRDVAKFLSLDPQHSSESPIEKHKHKKHVNIEVEMRPISTYTDILGGVSV